VVNWRLGCLATGLIFTFEEWRAYGKSTPGGISERLRRILTSPGETIKSLCATRLFFLWDRRQAVVDPS
jgi:hypothetical protein